MAYSSYVINKSTHLDRFVISIDHTRKSFKKEFKKCAATLTDFKYTILLLEIIDKVFLMSNIERIYDSSTPFILDNDIQTPSKFTSSKDYEQYFTLKHINMM